MRSSRPAPDGASITPTGPIPVEGEVRLRVRYCECDPMSVAHHSAFVPWLEIGRTELLRAAGVSYAQMEAVGIFLVVTRLDLRYKAPARYDDLVVVVTRVTGGGRVRIEHEYEVWRDSEDGRGKSVLLATAASTLACVGAEGAVRELPAWLAPARLAAGSGG